MAEPFDPLADLMGTGQPAATGGGSWMDSNFMGGGSGGGTVATFTRQDLTTVLPGTQPGTGGNTGVTINGGFTYDQG